MSKYLKEINAIVACDLNHAIGLNGKLPWEGKLKSEMHHFARHTRNVPGNIATKKGKNAVVMGRKTWQSIPEKFRPLKGRFNVVLSNSLKNSEKNDSGGGGDYVIKTGLTEALQFLDAREDIFKIWIIGGSSLYEEAISGKICDNLFITRILEKFEGTDTFIPDPVGFGYVKLEKSVALDLKEVHSEDGMRYRYEIWKKSEDLSSSEDYSSDSS